MATRLDVGAKRKRPPDIEPHTLVGLGALEARGMMVLPLPQDVNDRLREFLNSLDAGSARWYTEIAGITLAAGPIAKPGAGFKAEAVRDSARSWDALADAERRDVLAQFSPGTESGRELLFDNGKRKAWAFDRPYGEYVRNVTQRVRQGNSPLAQSPNQPSWTLEGFGFNSHLITNLGLEIVNLMADELERLGFSPGPPTHFPHLIYKPPRGAKLAAHHDQLTPSALLLALETHVASSVPGEPSMKRWVDTHGAQMLAHLVGALGDDDGPTFGICHLTPERFCNCMRLLRTATDNGDRVGSAPIQQEWWDKVGGPYWFDWVGALPYLNERLQSQYQDDGPPLQMLPIKPARGDAQAPYVAFWPVGWPHGSMSNQKRRVTSSVPIRLTASVALTEDDKRKQADVVAWLRAVAVLASSENGEERAAAEAHVASRADADGFADGKTHRNPGTVARLLRKNTGWFRELAPTPATVERFVSRFGMESAAAAASPSLPALPPSNLAGTRPRVGEKRARCDTSE